MTKQEVTQEVVDQLNQSNPELGVTPEQAAAVINQFTQTVRKAIIGGKHVYIRQFGSFGPKHRAQKTARNISAGTSMVIPAHYIPAFVPASGFVEEVRTSVNDDLPF